MQRISTNMPNDDMQYHLRLRQWRMNELQNRMAEQTRIKELRDDPVGAAHSSRYQSLLVRLNRYVDNIGTVQSNYRLSEEYLKSANEVLHRVREIAVQGANSTYSKQQMKMMGIEVNQLLNHLVEAANARSGDGQALFAGDRVDSQPFRALKGKVPGADGQVITQVLYTGGMANNAAEVSEGSYVTTGLAGNQVFWAEQNEIMSDVDATSYVVQRDSSILIDNSQVDLKAGDNIYAVIAKINDSSAAVRAALDPVKNSLVISSTYPHQIWIEDGAPGSVLRDLGITTDFGKPPNNIAAEARSSGGSVFDMIVFIRDKLFSGESLHVGGAGIKGLDLAQNNLLSALAELGSKYERLDFAHSRISNEIPEIQRRNSVEMDIDIAEAIMNLKVLEYTHKAALGTAARIMQPTLLDFLR
ncbi:MAG: flagellar hook-associated protein 3 [Spirochaetales bacterium]|nr:flagellar hook-associated protein 3 [Spirochaetales bacterium]